MNLLLGSLWQQEYRSSSRNLCRQRAVVLDGQTGGACLCVTDDSLFSVFGFGFLGGVVGENTSFERTKTNGRFVSFFVR